MSADASGAVRGPHRHAGARLLSRNDPRQYDELAGQWWRPDGAFAMLHWLAEARARLIPPARRPGAVLVDVGCGGGLLAPHLTGKGYHHVGVDLVRSALTAAAAHGVAPLNADAGRLPLTNGCADVVAAGELLEHVPNWPAAVAEICRVLRPGGLLVLDTLNATALSRLLAVRVAEWLPIVPRGLHDPRLFVDPQALVAECARHGVGLSVRGIRPAVWPMVRWLARAAMTSGDGPAVDGHRVGRSRPGVGARPRIVPTWSTAVLYQGRGVKKR
ncbi:MAG TPA: methyltransferase domain-containing protein [Micromonosporaceae bacterium]|nr:methyltransferase domain-containing protein [Micromonosporaceae bacterium]